MKNNLFICWHLGLGDAIVCAPIVRHYAGEHELVVIPVKYHNVASVTYLFRDLENVAIRPVEDDREMIMFRDQVWKKQLVLNLGGFGDNFLGQQWDSCMYRQAGLPFDLRWDGWQCKRDEAAEKLVFDITPFNHSCKNVFVHDDLKRGFKIDDSHVLKDSWMLCPDPEVSTILFHWRAVFEACDEIHCIASSFAHFIDSINLPKKPKKFLHAYARAGEPLATFRGWEILT